MYEGLNKFKKCYSSSFVKAEREIRYEIGYNGNLHCCFSDYADKKNLTERVWFDFTLVDIDIKDFGCVDFKVFDKSIDNLIDDYYINQKFVAYRLMSIDYVDNNEFFSKVYSDAVNQAKEIYYNYNKPFEKYDVIQYFDNCFDGYIKKGLSKIEAIKMRDEYKKKTNRYLVSFDIKVHEDKQS